MVKAQSDPISIFLAYAQEDEGFLKPLERHLSTLKQQGNITIWHRNKITPGTDAIKAYNTALQKANIIILLVSVDFLFFHEIEIASILARHQAGTACVIPLLLRDVDYEKTPLSHIQALPRNKKPIIHWANRDKAYSSIISEIGAIIELNSLKASELSIENNRSDSKENLHKGGITGRAIKPISRNIVMYINKGLSLHDMGRYEEAIGAYDQAISFDSNCIPAYCNKSNALRLLGKYEEVIKICDQVTNIAPENELICFNKGLVLFDMGRYEEAIEAYDRTINLDSTFAFAHNNRGNALKELGRYEEAIEAYDRAINLDPDDPDFYKAKAETLLDRERYEEAIEIYSKAISLDPNDAVVYHNMGVANQALKRIKKAEMCFEKARELGLEELLADQ